MPRLISVCTAIAILCIAIAPVRAEEPWQYEISVPIWAAGLDGDVATLPGVPAASVNASFGDLVENLDMAVMLAGEAHNGRVGLYGDLFYVDLEATGSVPGPLFSTASVNAKTVFATAAGFWRAWSNEGASLDVMAGARLWSVDTDLALGAGILAATAVSYDESWVDPLIGLKAKGTLGGDRFFLGGGILFGGFGVGSDLMWDANISLGYNWTDGFSTSIGYRYLAVDYSDGAFLYDVVQQGPTIALIWNF